MQIFIKYFITAKIWLDTIIMMITNQDQQCRWLQGIQQVTIKITIFLSSESCWWKSMKSESVHLISVSVHCLSWLVSPPHQYCCQHQEDLSCQSRGHQCFFWSSNIQSPRILRSNNSPTLQQIFVWVKYPENFYIAWNTFLLWTSSDSFCCSSPELWNTWGQLNISTWQWCTWLWSPRVCSRSPLICRAPLSASAVCSCRLHTCTASVSHPQQWRGELWERVDNAWNTLYPDPWPGLSMSTCTAPEPDHNHLC